MEGRQLLGMNVKNEKWWEQVIPLPTHRFYDINFESEKEKLISNRHLVLKKVEETNHKVEKVNDVVLEWLNDAKKLIEEVEKLGQTIKSIEEQKGTNDAWRRSLEHAASYAKMLEKIKTLNTKCEFDPFSIPIPSLEYFSAGNLLCFNSTEEASDRLLNALQDDSSYIIGLYGKRGSGKTTLVKAVGEKAKFLNIFNVILFANVSQNPNLRRIQDQIANSLNLKFDKNTEAARARKIYSTLKNMDSVLVILDDVWAKFDPEDIGIPCDGNRCKVLVTTRRKQECTLMNCKLEIPLHTLSKEEAWTLLKKHSGIDDESSPELLNVSRDVAFECKGLPGTIIDVGSSLESKPIKRWKETLLSLRHSMDRYQIFLSFRGEDTRYSFTGFLYNALCQEGFKTFMDEGELIGGDQISQSLIEAIEASRFSIIVFSENYAYSTWCLDELVTILYYKKEKDHLVLPIFYKVKPSDVRHQRNSYGEAMAQHENTFQDNPEKVNRWRSALYEAANLSGMHYTTGYEYKFIETVVEMANNIKSRLYIQSVDMD